MDALEKLTEEFTKFPGIGPRQARRFAYFVLTQSKDSNESLIAAMESMRRNVVQCSSCYVYFTKDNGDTTCTICSNVKRNKNTLLVIEKDIDLQTIEKSRVYNGLYFVLGGIVLLHDQTPSSKVRIQELVRKIKQLKEEGLQEVVVALSATPDCDHTYKYIKTVLSQTIPDIKVSILGRGLSTGTEIEYIDPNTLSQAIDNRK